MKFTPNHEGAAQIEKGEPSTAPVVPKNSSHAKKLVPGAGIKLTNV